MRICEIGVGVKNFFSKFLHFFVFLNFKRFFFLELFDLEPPSFAKMHIYVYIADLHGEVGQNILNGQKNMLKR